MGDDRVGHGVIDGRAQEDDPVAQQARVDVHPAFATVGLLDYVRDENAHAVVLSLPAALGLVGFGVILRLGGGRQLRRGFRMLMFMVVQRGGAVSDGGYQRGHRFPRANRACHP